MYKPPAPMLGDFDYRNPVQCQSVGKAFGRLLVEAFHLFVHIFRSHILNYFNSSSIIS